ncbi:hypothetical protein ACFLXQ_01390 [Chloroflexota bacterium]
MKLQQTKRQELVWGGLLIFFGVVGLVEAYTDLTEWVWVAILVVAGLGVFGVYLTDRSQWGLLIPTYVLWAVAGLVALIKLNVLQDEFIATYVLTAIALPFLVVFLRNREQWWPLIPAYVLLAVGVMVGLIGAGVLNDSFVATYVLTAIALPFLLVFLRNRALRWALIPTYVLLAIGVMVGLIEAGVLDDLLIPAYVMFTIAIPFLVVYARNPKQLWALILGGIMAVIGLSFLVAEALIEYVVPTVLILAGIWILARQFIRQEEKEAGDEGLEEVEPETG